MTPILIIIGWLMAIGGLMFAIAMTTLLSTPLEGMGKHIEQVFTYIIIWSIPVVGFLIILFPDKFAGKK